MNADLLGFAALTGKYIVLSRPSTAEEVAAGAGPLFSAAGTLARVEDEGDDVHLTLDYGWGCSASGWSLRVYPDQATAAEFCEVDPPAGVTITLTEREREGLLAMIGLLLALANSPSPEGWTPAVIAKLRTGRPSPESPEPSPGSS